MPQVFYSFPHPELADNVCISEEAAEASSLYSQHMPHAGCGELASALVWMVHVQVNVGLTS